MISKNFLYLIVRVQDLDLELPPIESIPVQREYSEVLSNDLLGIPLEREIDFIISCYWKQIPTTYSR